MKLFKIFILAFFVVSLISCGGAEERKAAYLEKAKSSVAAGDLDKARIELKNVLQIDPKDGDAYYQLGKIYEQQKDYKKAYGNYLKAEELKPGLLENQAKLGRFYLLLMNDSKQAQAKVDLILSKEPDNADGLLLKAAMMMRNNNTDEAIAITKDIVVKNPDHSESVAFLASLYSKEKKNKEAINVLDDALKNNKNNSKLKKLLASILVSNKNYSRAEIIYKDFLERNPDDVSSYNNLAVFYSMTGDKARAEKILRESIDNKLDDEDRILTLIKYLRETKSNDEAIKELKSYVATNRRLGRLKIALAELFILNKDKKMAIKVFKEVINDFPEEVTGITARTALASIYISDKNYDDAAKVIEDAFLISPNDPQVNYLRAQFAVRNKDFEKAIISLRIVTKEMPENIDAYILLANIYKKESNNEQVRSTLNSAYENNRGNADVLLKLAQYYSSIDVVQSEKIINEYNALKQKDYDGLSLKAAILNRNSKYEEAYKIAEELMSSFSDKPNGYLQAMPYLSQQDDKKRIVSVLENGYMNTKYNRKLLILLTTIQVSEKKFDIIESRIKEEIKLSPDDAELSILLAKVYLAKNDVKSAMSKLNTVTKSSPEVEESYLLLSQIYQKKGDIDSVEKILISGKANVKSSLKIPMKLAGLYEYNQSYNKAIDVYKSIHKMHPENLVIVNNLASMLSDYGNSKEDLKLAKTLSMKLEETKQPVFLDTIGWVYYKSGDYQKSVTYLMQAVKKAEKINVFNYHLGMAYKMSGDKTQAKTYLEKSMADGKNFKEKELAKEALKDL